MVIFDPIGIREAFATQVRIADVGGLAPVADKPMEKEIGSIGGFD